MREETHYLYRHYDASDVLLYVGVTLCPRSRLTTHKSCSPWGEQIARVELSPYVGWDGRQQALDDEAYAIACEAPLHNRTFAKFRAARAARVRVVSGVRLGSRAKKLPTVRHIDGIKYIKADVVYEAMASVLTAREKQRRSMEEMFGIKADEWGRE